MTDQDQEVPQKGLPVKKERRKVGQRGTEAARAHNRERAFHLVVDGYTRQQVADALNVDVGTVSRMLREYRDARQDARDDEQTDDMVEALEALALTRARATRWLMRLEERIEKELELEAEFEAARRAGEKLPNERGSRALSFLREAPKNAATLLTVIREAKLAEIKLLGLEPPTRLTGADGGPLQHQILAIQNILSRVGEPVEMPPIPEFPAAFESDEKGTTDQT